MAGRAIPGILKLLRLLQYIITSHSLEFIGGIYIQVFIYIPCYDYTGLFTDNRLLSWPSNFTTWNFMRKTEVQMTLLFQNTWECWSNVSLGTAIRTMHSCCPKDYLYSRLASRSLWGCRRTWNCSGHSAFGIMGLLYTLDFGLAPILGIRICVQSI